MIKLGMTESDSGVPTLPLTSGNSSGEGNRYMGERWRWETMVNIIKDLFHIYKNFILNPVFPHHFSYSIVLKPK